VRGARGDEEAWEGDLYGVFETKLDVGAGGCEDLGGRFSEFDSIEFADDLGGAERLLSAEEL